MSVTFSIHVEPVGNHLVWWAETEAVPGLNIAADTLRELRVLIDEAAGLQVPDETDVRLELVTDEVETEGGPSVESLSDSLRPPVPASAGFPTPRRVLVDLTQVA